MYCKSLLFGFLVMIGIMFAAHGCSQEGSAIEGGKENSGALKSRAEHAEASSSGRPVLEKTPKSCELLSAKQAERLLKGKAVLQAQSRHGQQTSSCIYANPGSDRSVGLTVMHLKKSLFDYHKMSAKEFADRIVSSFIRKAQFVAAQKKIGNGTFAFETGNGYGIWLNTGIGAKNPFSDKISNEYFVMASASGYKKTDEMKGIATKLVSRAQKVFEKTAGD